VLYVDKPDNRPAAIWGINIATGAQAPYSTAVGALQHGDRYVIAPQSQSTQNVTVHDRETDRSWVLNGVGSMVFVSPDGKQIAYDGRNTQEPLYANRRRSSITVAELDGSNPRVLATIFGGGIVDWFPDGTRLLMLGTETLGAPRPALWHVDVATGAVEKLDEAAHMRNISISPDGAWVVFLTLFEENPIWNTTWAMNVHTGEQQRLDFVGRYEWKSTEAATLVYVPLRDSAEEGFAVWQLDVASEERVQLVDPVQTPLFIANGDWALAPDGKRLAFVSSEDYSIWLVEMAH
jgi:Tol biopolymer transport system component